MIDHDLRNAFENLKEDVVRTIQTEERLEQITRQRTWVRPALLAFAGAGAVALIIGVIVGTYSSVFVASPLVLTLGLSREDMMPVKKEGADQEQILP